MARASAMPPMMSSGFSNSSQAIVILREYPVLPTNEAIPAAIDHLKAHWEAIIESWRS